MPATRTILYEDDILLALHKPSGVLTEGGAHREDDLEQQAQRYTGKKTYCCHRLDRLTSGIIIFRKTEHYKAKLCELFATRQIRKIYWGLVDGLWPASQTHIETQIVRTEVKGVFANGTSGGKTAISKFQILGTSTDQSSSWLSILLETGRTHQARLHCLHANCPIIGDKLYHPTSQADYFGLHARELTFLHPKSDQPTTITAPPPDSWKAPLAKFPQSR